MNARWFLDKKVFLTVSALVILVLAACQPAAQSNNPPAAQATSAATVALPVTGSTLVATQSGVTPSVTISDQPLVNDSVTVAEVVSDGPGWIVIHAQKDGKIGPVAGYAAVKDGSNANVVVKLDPTMVTPTMYAMLHKDVGQVGTYEFPGADGPVLIGEDMVSPAFQVTGGIATQESTMASSSSGSGLYGDMSSATQSASEPVQLKVTSNASLGNILTDGKGMTLYVFVKDQPNQSNCKAGCLQAWPPLTVASADQVTAGDGIDASKIGTIPFSGGGFQVTYNQKPLYYWAEDMNPGDTNGQGINNTWFVLKP